ncbi:LOW QUALITY PROTEIN: A disintegrin and metalloproteinase with thrombospondin motifs 7 [Talpa occidentalis]|uniref:LOW QUALITY PROTEIN: A disintegrin and metalloproteinase with thrombospondin motifs 7 n=1 Tax=Talpa occidentalis TaxID=50954 RepID=UPI0023F82BD5|nr:LOW QUALITY PROTEIN: A disintegrin and metalloproteinase with thrombospondin motifs 7 [Talpa occidentalis]
MSDSRLPRPAARLPPLRASRPVRVSRAARRRLYIPGATRQRRRPHRRHRACAPANGRPPPLRTRAARPPAAARPGHAGKGLRRGLAGPSSPVGPRAPPRPQAPTPGPRPPQPPGAPRPSPLPARRPRPVLSPARPRPPGPRKAAGAAAGPASPACAARGAAGAAGAAQGPSPGARESPSLERPAPGWGARDIVHPVRVDAGGAFLSYELWPRALRKRAVSAPRAAPAFYELLFHGRTLRFNLSANAHLLAPGFVRETRRRGGLGRTLVHTQAPACHLLGHVRDPELEGGPAAISACDGLKGMFRLSDQDYFIEPLEGAPARPGRAQPHVVYRRQAPDPRLEWGGSRPPGTCGVQESLEPEPRREQWQQRRQQRSVSKEKWVETLVVADAKMVEYHGQPQVESYVLTVMNMVAGLFHDPSIGNPIHVTIVRLVLLEDEEEGLKVTHHADHTLRSFCKWQKSINMRGDAHPLHHDTAILLTRKDLCAAVNQPCETLGLSHVAGMCQPLRSCSVNEDSGLPLAFTVAHELGHSFGIQHDGSGNDCQPVGKRPFIMSPQLLYDAAPLTWSRCSRQYITRFLDRGWGQCLDDPPAKDVIDFPSVPPGVLYDVGHQCRLQYGPYSAFCRDMDNVCHTLWCSVGTTCHSKLDAAVDGTRCGESKWCLNGECVPVGFRPAAVDGGWSGWSAWSVCSRSCGAGVQSAERQCTQPPPKYKGRYCVGERKRFRLCSLQACPPGHPSFRHVQCSRFDTMLYQGQLHTWVPVANDENPCELHCQPTSTHFAEKLRDAVVDGTPCYQGQASRDLCINGICKSVGCDFQIDSGAEEDRCGVCRGNGSSCHTVTATFQEAEGLGYVDVALIPAGARDIRIEEVAEAANFLALRGEDPEEHFLNGGWTIQWAGDYLVAGATFTYRRAGNWENLTSRGPTLRPVWIQLLFQERNPGVRYEYTIHRAAAAPGQDQLPVFSWHFGPWTACTVTCGSGTQRQSVHCMSQQAGPVDDGHCDPLGRPEDRQRKCSEEPCPARWWAGEWQPCSRSCGPGGLSRRAVLCVRGVGPHEQRALQLPACQHLPPPPAETPCNHHVPCPATWAVGNWSQCSATCGAGTRHRTVLCTNDSSVPCEEAQRPAGEAACPLPPCPRVPGVLGPEGSGSGSYSHELFNEVDFIPRLPPPRPPAPAPAPEDNAIDEAPRPGLPGPVLVDDFYYDYNFITFHEDLSYGALGQPSPDEAGTGGQTPPPPSRPAPASAPPGTEDQGARGTYPAPRPRQPDPSPLPTPEPAPVNSVTFVIEQGAPTGAPGLGLPGLLRPPTSEGGTELPAAPGPTLRSGGPRAARAALPLPGGRRHEVSEDEEEAPGPGVSPLPPRPSPTAPLFSRGAAPSTPRLDPVEPGTPGASRPVDPGGARASPPGWHCAPTSGGHPEPGALGPRSVPRLRAAAHPAYPHPAHSSRAPEAWPWAPVLAEGEPSTGLPPAGNASWEVGNWSECSTTCGLGAAWRPVRCSSGREEDCTPASRPQPARRCHLRPCATWLAGSWSKCSRSCGGGFSVRDVQCVDTRDLRPLRPFHCQPGPAQPPTRRPCGAQPCLGWYTSAWRECSEACGGGEQQRLVTCPEPGLCEEALRPNGTRPCNTQPCAQWVVGPWGQCSTACGGGVQRRLVSCINSQTGLPEEDSGQCGHEAGPDSARPCGTQDCQPPAPAHCERDRLAFGFCEMLRLLGRCQLPTIRAQCCRSCPRLARAPRPPRTLPPRPHRLIAHGPGCPAHRREPALAQMVLSLRSRHPSPREARRRGTCKHDLPCKVCLGSLDLGVTRVGCGGGMRAGQPLQALLSLGAPCTTQAPRSSDAAVGLPSHPAAAAWPVRGWMARVGLGAPLEPQHRPCHMHE